MADLETEVYNSFNFRNFKERMFFHEHYQIAMNYFIAEHPIRVGGNMNWEKYTLAWIKNYMAINYNYIPRL